MASEEKKVAASNEVDQLENAHTSVAGEKIETKEDALQLRVALEHSKLGGYVPLTPEEKHRHRALNRKFDFFVLPFCVGIYLLNGLDRSNIGNAQTFGFTDDLGLPSTAVNTATSLFFCTVCFRLENRHSID